MASPSTPLGDGTRITAPTASRSRPGWTEHAGRAGAVAALLMLAAQLLWRLAWSSAGVQAFPEFIVAAVARLTPLDWFGYATENYGSFAQNSLFVAVLIGIVAVGYEAGVAADRLHRGGRLGTGSGARLAAGLAVAAALLLFTLLVVLPIANLGLFANDSRHPGEVVLQLVATFALFGVAWTLLASPAAIPATGARPATAEAVNRRAVLQGAWGIGTLGLLAGVGGMTWRLIRPASKGDRAAADRTAQDIVATAEARGAAPPTVPAAVAPTSAPLPVLTVPGGPVASDAVAAADEDALDGEGPASVAAPDTLARFAELDAAGTLTPVLTSVPDFYHVSKNISDPTVDGDGWSLSIKGLVDRPLQLSYEELVTRATTRKITTLGCISNEINGDLIGTAEWTGLPLRDLLVEAGVQAGAVDLKFRCADDYEDSIPVAQGLDPDSLVVVGMNGEPLRPDHGYPARMIIPGIYGMKNVKWVESIELVDHDFKGYWQTRGWSDPAPYQIWGRIDLPGSGDDLQPGPALAAGVASAGDRGVQRVEVSLDDGETWADATLEPALNPPFTWVRWVFPFEATPGKHKLVMRAIDGNGTVADEERRPPLPDGATGWSRRTVNVEG